MPFEEIYAKWTEEHNETVQIAERTKSDNQSVQYEPTINELRKMNVQESLDLHNSLLDNALYQVEIFISQSMKKGLRKVSIVTGKGIHSPNGEAKIRPAVLAKVQQDSRIREIDLHPKAAEGGSGAIILILKKIKS